MAPSATPAVIPTTNFKVELKQNDTITATLPLQEHILPLSNLDLLLPPVDVSIFFCYKHDNEKYINNKVAVLKKSLAETLVLYYPFAGEVVMSSAGEPEVLCNNRGVDFYQVYADVDLCDLNLYNPDQSIEAKMVPVKKNGTLAVQVTELRCGSMIVACTFDHRIADAYSANLFLVSWAETAQSKPISLKPNFKRSMFNPRRPIISTHSAIDDFFATISSLPPPPLNPPPMVEDRRLASRIYVISAAQLLTLQNLASSKSDIKRSKLVSFSAFLWQLIAKCDSENGKDGLMTRMGLVVNGRSRLIDHNDELNFDRSMMEGYFGNVLTIPYGEDEVGPLGQSELYEAAKKVAQFLKVGATKDHFLDLIDWVEARRPEPALARVYCAGKGEESAVVVSCGRGFPAREVNFGWGRPWIGSYHFPWGGEAGYVMPMPSPARNGDWVVYMHLRMEQLKVLERVAGEVFRPLTKAYLDSIM